MPIEAGELLKYAGIDPEKFDTIDAAKEAFDTTFVKTDKIKDVLIKQPELADGIIGKRMSIIDRKLDDIVKASGVEYDSEALKGKKVEEKIEFFKPLIETRFSDLTKASMSGSGEREKTLAEEKARLESKLKDTSSLLADVKTQFETFKTDIVVKEKESKKKNYFESALGAVEFSPEVDELKKKGFIMTIKESYIVDLDEKDEPFVKDAKTGERVKSADKAGEFLGLSDIIKMEADKNKVSKQSPYAGNRNNFTPAQAAAVATQQAEPTRKLNGR
jgi:hypothetical protein